MKKHIFLKIRVGIFRFFVAELQPDGSIHTQFHGLFQTFHRTFPKEETETFYNLIPSMISKCEDHFKYEFQTAFYPVM